MKQFMIEAPFWGLFPHAKIGIVIARNIKNTYENTDIYEQMLLDAQKEALKHLKADTLSENDVIRVWRQAFTKFKTKKGARSSIEALLKRVNKGHSLGCINPLVDIYNTCSLLYALPCGGEDIDKFEGDIKLTLANGQEAFVALGSDKSQPPYEGEVVYKDSAGVICRCWNWREAIRTMLTDETQQAFLCIESVDPERETEFKKALMYLETVISDHLGGECKSFVLDKQNQSIKF